VSADTSQSTMTPSQIEERPAELDGRPPAGPAESPEVPAEAQSPGDGAPDLDTRFLCADGNCIGIIAVDGRCKVCGTPVSPEDVELFERTQRTRLGPEFERAAPEAVPDTQPSDSPSQIDLTYDDGDEAPDLEGRRLCSDGACVGVIGADNCCKVCGKPEEATI